MIRNAKITGTKIGKEMIQLFVECGVWKATIGGKPFDYISAFEVVQGICEVVGVENWEDLAGQYIRVKDEGCETKEIGNIIKEDWINLRDFTTVRFAEV